MKTTPAILGFLVLLAVSCASDSDSGASPGSAVPTHKPLSQRLDESNGYQVDSEGNWVPKNDKRSTFENAGASPNFKGNYDKKTYQAATKSKKSWWGSKEYGSKSYEGNTRNDKLRKSSRFDGQGARESGSPTDLPGAYATKGYGTGPARESRNHPISKPRDAQAQNRRSDYPQPEIIDWKQQRSLSLDQSRGILGR